MIDQKIKEICTQALSRVPAAENPLERLKLAFEFADKLYISNYLSSENKRKIIKKELCSFGRKEKKYWKKNQNTVISQ